MKKILFFFLLLTVLGCSANKVSKNHGFTSLETKFEKIDINKSNKNDVLTIIGPPSTKSKFDNQVWIYIERKQTQSKLKNLGRMKIYKNDVLVLEIDKYGILKQKEFYNKDDMNEIQVAKSTTEAEFMTFIESMNSKQFAMIQGFFDTMPKLSHTLTVTNPETGVESEVVLEGLSAFFA